MSRKYDDEPIPVTIYLVLIVVAFIVFAFYAGHYVGEPKEAKARTVEDVIEGKPCC
jgi:hypothetical protein